jgi:hypothetical protein
MHQQLIAYAAIVALATACLQPYCPQGSSIITNCYGNSTACCWWLAEPGTYLVCNGTDTFDSHIHECVNAYQSNEPECSANHTYMRYNNTSMCVEFYNQTYSDCPQGYVLDVPGEGRWTCDMWTPVLCS